VTPATGTPAAAPTLAAYDPTAFYDEAVQPDGRPRPGYGRILEALAELDLHALSDAIARDPRARRVTFASVTGPQRFHVDPVPRVFERREWNRLRDGLCQRARALGEFLTDVYGERRIVAAGVMPARVVDGAEHFEPWMLGVESPGGPAPVVGFDVVRGADGRLKVLEDNLRTPSGFTYALAARRIVDAHLPTAARLPRADIDACFDRLGDALRAAAPDGGGDPSIVLLSDGPANSAWYEHVTIARRLAIPVVQPSDLRPRGGSLYAALPSGRLREVQVVYRRTDEDRLSDVRSSGTWVADALLGPIRNGRLGVVNACGNGVADDKLVHAYVEDMVRFYLGEEPLVESVRTYDLGRREYRTRALGRLGALVVKPRAGYGGHGVVIGSQCTRIERDAAAAAIRETPERFVAQETVPLSRHPTVVDGKLVPRHVDLRAFAFGTGPDITVVPGGLTRVALEPGSLLVNSSQNGGGKDTWVVG
jgi:uncharacterized circularly permuted ATP-grasp superfamily protein